MEQNTQHSALLVMDMQPTILRRFNDTSLLVNKVSDAIAFARHRQIPVIYVTVGFRSGAPEISANNKGFTASKQQMLAVDMDEMLKIHPALLPAVGEITVIKRRISAFTGSDLEVVLRAFNINHLILTGVATSGVVLSTVREAADKDYRLTVLSDCCADADEEVHRVLTTKVFTRQADVLMLEEWKQL
ncbi:MAG: isochorismatase [Bacteroidota bacterium]|nr:isochorismatase [Bacteroidota bacterium]